MQRSVLALAALLALAGCVTTYTEPPASGSAATMVYSRHESLPRWGNTQVLHIVGDERCSTRNRIKDYVPLGNQEPHSFRLESGERRYFYLISVHTQGGALGFTDTSCTNVVSFVPEAGKTYSIQQGFRQRNCAVELKDEAGAKPASFVRHDFDERCIQVW